jgi:hypothetical protein
MSIVTHYGTSTAIQFKKRADDIKPGEQPIRSDSLEIRFELILDEDATCYILPDANNLTSGHADQPERRWIYPTNWLQVSIRIRCEPAASGLIPTFGARA